jgi:hypothetical protein
VPSGDELGVLEPCPLTVDAADPVDVLELLVEDVSVDDTVVDFDCALLCVPVALSVFRADDVDERVSMGV